MADAAPSPDGPKAPSEPDLAHFVQRRRLDQYEQAIARQGYAYGVDIRRAQWLASSSVGNAAVRAVDRGWTGLSKSLLDTSLVPADLELPRELLARVAELRALLSAPKPALYILAPGADASSWAPVTPLGPARGGARWLVLDAPSLLELDAVTRDFWLAAGLAHLQCGHAVFYAAHRLIHDGRAPKRVQWLQRLARPWSRVMSFSSDRAGLMAAPDLESALVALESVHDVERASPWLPHGPDLELRREALREFERSVVVARVRAARSRAGQEARVIPSEEEAPETDSGEGAEAGELPFVPADAWSVARCDRRLTERLGLL